MSEIFISYARSTEAEAHLVAESLRTLGYDVWRDDQLPAHLAYSDVIEERLRSAKAVVAIWSADALRSQWVRAEADVARLAGTLVQLSIDGTVPPLPFNQIQCADMNGWTGDDRTPGWRKVVMSIAALIEHGGQPPHAALAAATSKPARGLPEKPSIAVLPFANMSGDPEQDYFVDGLMEEIVTSLTRIRTIFVIASGSSLSLKGQGIAPIEAARRLGVRYVLEGSVRKSGDRIRIAVKLVDAVAGHQIWADRFDDTFSEIFELQDRIAQSVAGVIEFSVQNAETQRLIHRPTSDLEGYDLYLRALMPFRTYSRKGLYEALDLLERAISLDPKYALALSLAAACHAIIMQFHWTDDLAHHGQKLAEMLQRSLQSGSEDPQVLASGALALWTASDFARAKQLADRAAALNPGSSFPLLARGQIAAAIGDLEIAEDCLDRSMHLDPFSPNRALQLGAMAQTRFAQKKFAEAAELCREWGSLSRSPMSIGLPAAAYGHLGQMREAHEALSELKQLSDMAMSELAAMFYQRPEHRQLFLDGIALAQNAERVA